MYDVLIVGGGPAGLSAALILGRCRRRVLVCDQGQPRNLSSKSMHGFLSRDGVPPLEFLKVCRKQLKAYPNVEFHSTLVTGAQRHGKGFRITLADGRQYSGRKLLLATGLVDALPKIEGIREFYGTSVHHCPYCDGWEVRDRALAAYGKGKRGYRLALSLLAWSKDVILLTHGVADLTRQDRLVLKRNGVQIVEDKILRLQGKRGKLQKVVFKNGGFLSRDAFFFNTGSYPQSPLAQKLGCAFDRKGGVKTGEYEATCVPGLYAAGNILREVQLVIVAAAEGVNAAFGINSALQRESLK